MRKGFRAGIGLAMALWLAPPASADTVTIGAPAPSPTTSGSCNSCAVMQFASDPASPTYVVPPAPAGSSWTITSWTSRGGIADASAAIEVWRATANAGEFRLIAIGPEQRFPTDTLVSHAVNIPVLPGDTLGVDSETTNYDPDYGGVAGDHTFLSIGTPAQGQTMGGTSSDFMVINYGSSRLNVAATLTSIGPPARRRCRSKRNAGSTRSGALRSPRRRSARSTRSSGAGVVAATMPPSWRSPRRDSRERGATSGARSTRSPLRA